MIIDVSKWQGKINWEKVKPNCDFAIMRASCGTKLDTKIERNVTECGRLDIPYHLYHYLKGTTVAEMEKEAGVFAGFAMETDALFLVLDCEYGKITTANNKKKGVAKELVQAFVDTVRLLYKAEKKECPPIAVYIGHHLYTKWNLDYASFAYVWIPRYGKNSGKPETKPCYKCDLWQYTSKGRITGISGRVDVSQLNGDKPMSFFTTKQEVEPMAQVIIGSARIDENGKAKGGQAGNQTGKELSTQNWYLHSKGWYVLRAKDPAKREMIAACMEAACKSPYIGYDQSQRLTLYNAVKDIGFDVSKLEKNVETDCSALVRVCCAYAGIKAGNFTTANEVSVLMSTGAFEKLTDDAHCKKSANLLRGDILVTRTKGHTVVVLSDGSNAAPVSGTGKVVRITGNSVNVRSGNGTQYSVLQTVNKDETFTYIATSEDDWHAVGCGGCVGWVSGKYSVVEE